MLAWKKHFIQCLILFHYGRHLVPGDDVKFTCVACHPTEFSVTTGLSNGNIILW